MFTFNRSPIPNSNDQSDQFTLNDHHHTSTIIMCVIFAVVLFVFTTVMCCAYAKKRKRNPHAIFPESKISAFVFLFEKEKF